MVARGMRWGVVAGVILGLAGCGEGSTDTQVTPTTTVADCTAGCTQTGTSATGTVGEAGGSITYEPSSLPGITVALAIPQGAVATSTAFTITPLTQGFQADSTLLPGTTFDMTPAGTAFAQPLDVTIGYKAADVSALGLNETEMDLALAGGVAVSSAHKVRRGAARPGPLAANGGAWAGQGGIVDTALHKVLAHLTTLGTVGVLRRAPAQVTGLLATSGDGKIDLAWDAAARADSYTVYWSLTSGVTPANGTPIPDVLTTTYTHTPLTNGTPVYYVVVGKNTRQGPPSAEATATPGAASLGAFATAIANCQALNDLSVCSGNPWCELPLLQTKVACIADAYAALQGTPTCTDTCGATLAQAGSDCLINNDISLCFGDSACEASMISLLGTCLANGDSAYGSCVTGCGSVRMQNRKERGTLVAASECRPSARPAQVAKGRRAQPLRAGAPARLTAPGPGCFETPGTAVKPAPQRVPALGAWMR